MNFAKKAGAFGVEFHASREALTSSQIPSGSPMPLPPPTAQRTRMHVRSVQLDGYKRGDGCWDIEARLTDVKDHDYPLSSGLRQRGERCTTCGCG
jgi:hypothetical protein